ncbi:transcription termination factor MTERF9, chloroplastic isoform X1 [Phoenix dactylifera]|uniref:Transcription termination factor MTERF9, chloroplastic isoform X1 n=1 Tax=Phoenix dactylifera TaxID=42345 RepID=A0A8B7CK13_PHODC|nr:transcription termination factor MTERF9, chloroplastic isoform X1 [Phoenix dactylifera]XP_026663437.1 transcription termination factor MTERF9, chloroplastic isoform X1 [Phoenix dactylifera]
MALLCLHSNPARFFFSPPPKASRRGGVGFAVFSSHSNPRILKSSRRSRSGRGTTPYDDDHDGGEEESEEEEEALPYDLSLLDYSSDFEGSRQAQREEMKRKFSKTGQSRKLAYWSSDVHDIIIPRKANSQDYYRTPGRTSKKDAVELDSQEKLKNGKFTKSRFQKLVEELDFDEKWFPLIEYLSTFGLKESHFVSIYERHMLCLQMNLVSVKERLEFLLSVGVKHSNIKRILMRQPQILEYTVENNLKSHVAFLVNIGIPDSRIGQVITAAPSFFSYSVEHSLKPTIRYLVEEVGIKESDVSKVVQLSPQILVQRIDNSWTSRFSFLSKELGAPRDNIVKMVTKHPQLLHYSIEDGILPRINFLRGIGMRNSDILKVLTNLTQVLSLSLEGNLKPKYLYLVNELHNEVHSLTKYPMYLSLSLEQRIRPRHKFLVSLKKAPKGPFPLSSLVPTDECFCQQWAGTSLEKYVTFRQSLLIEDFARMYERKR